MALRDEIEQILHEAVATSVVIVSTRRAYEGEISLDVLEDFPERDRNAMFLALIKALEKALLLAAAEIDDLSSAVGPN